MKLPMLFLPGDGDDFTEMGRLRQVARELGAPATLRIVESGDRSFKARKSAGKMTDHVFAELAGAQVDWAVETAL